MLIMKQTQNTIYENASKKKFKQSGKQKIYFKFHRMSINIFKKQKLNCLKICYRNTLILTSINAV